MSVLINSEPITVAINSEPIVVEVVSAPINVEVSGARGATGVVPERLIYIADVTTTGGPYPVVTGVDILNTTGKTFTWDKLDNVNARLACNEDISFFNQAINITWYRKNTTDSNLYMIRTNLNTMIFGITGFLGSTYRCLIEFDNF